MNDQRESTLPPSVARFVAKIDEADADGVDAAHLSTTEAIMVALALCNRAYLPEALRKTHAGRLWWRLDDNQRVAIQAFGSRAAHGGQLAADRPI